MTNSKKDVLMEKETRVLDEVTIRFAGDSGDGMQLTGGQFTNTSAAMGNDLSTLPDYPAEIRAPIGTTYGVSGFQIHFGATEINTPGDHCDVLVAMNAASLKVNLRSLIDGGIIIVNTDGFGDKNLKLAGYTQSPLSDGSLSKFQVFQVDITKLTNLALADMNLSQKVVDKTKNFFALGMMYWMFNRTLDNTTAWITEKFEKKPELVEANTRVMKAGWNYAETTDIFAVKYDVKPAPLTPGKYRNINGNQATALGFVAAADKANLPLFLGSYPITPATGILEELAYLKNFGVKTFQCEDEIAGITSAIGAAFGGNFAITTTSGPGVALKTEAMGLAVMTELPLVIVNVQRGGPSTGLPTKTEQADLLQAIYGRNGEAPIPVIAANSPSDCFNAAFEASRIALKYMTPVILLTDGYIANGSEPWLIPEVKDLQEIPVKFRKDPVDYQPYLRDEKTLAREWAIPGTPGLEHRIGGLEKHVKTGNINYEPENHHAMINLRAAKVDGIAKDIPLAKVEGDESGELLVVGWGGTYGTIKTAVDRKRKEGKSVAHLHLRHLNPMPLNVGEILTKYKTILVPEINLGQLIKILREKFLVPAVGLNKVQGLPFRSIEIEQKIDEILGGKQ